MNYKKMFAVMTALSVNFLAASKEESQEISHRR